MNHGDLRLVQHRDGSLNIANALSSKKPIKQAKEELHLDLKSIKLSGVDISKYNEANGILVDAHITEATSRFKTIDDHMFIGLNSRFELSLIEKGDTTFIKHKHFVVDTEFDLNDKTKILNISPTEIQLEKATFGFDGSIALNENVDLDLRFHGNKPNFNLFLALAPEELAPTLEQFDNKGKIYFEAQIKGPSANGQSPTISNLARNWTKSDLKGPLPTDQNTTFRRHALNCKTSAPNLKRAYLAENSRFRILVLQKLT
jgi:hypothetical protein